MGDLIRQVDADTENQKVGISHIATALGQFEKTTQDTAAMPEESAPASAELNAQANSLTDIVRWLEALVQTKPFRQNGFHRQHFRRKMI